MSLKTLNRCHAMAKMDIERPDIHTPREEMSCVLRHRKCKKHHGRCPNPWIMRPPVHDFLHRLPGELQVKVITEIVMPQVHCIKHIFGHCHNPWECKDGAHTCDSATAAQDMPAVTPSTCYTSRCQLICEEGHKLFFQNNVFVFKSRHRFYGRPLERTIEDFRSWFRTIDFQSRNDRDCRATRLLDFFDLPLWRGRASPNLLWDFDDGSYEHVDNYRYTIRHLVFTLDSDGREISSLNFRYTWAWAITVDFKTLPNLQTLVLDLKGYSYRQLQNPEIPQKLYNEQLEAEAKRMECLELKSLIIYGLCSGPEYWGKKLHRRRIERLFQPALGTWGKLELRDEEHFVNW